MSTRTALMDELQAQFELIQSGVDDEVMNTETTGVVWEMGAGLGWSEGGMIRYVMSTRTALMDELQAQFELIQSGVDDEVMTR